MENGNGKFGFFTPLTKLTETTLENPVWTEEREMVFLESLAKLKNFDVEKDGPEAERWVDEKIEIMKRELDSSSIADCVYVDFEMVREAFLFAYLSHFGQRRKVGQIPYAQHLFGSICQYIHIKEKEYKVRRPPEDMKVDFTNDFIKLLLHDLLEDFLKGIKIKTEEKQAWFTFLSAYLELRFGEDVSKFVSYVATKFTKRPFTKLPDTEDMKEKMALSRLDFISLVLGITEETRNAAELLLKAAERQDNLATVGDLPNADRKGMETYNMALAAFVGGFRSPGKDLMGEGFRHLYPGEKQKVFMRFEKIVAEWQEKDRKNFEDVSSDLHGEIAEILGHDDFDVQYRPLAIWRVHEELMRVYKTANGDDEMGGLNLFNDEILDDGDFKKVLEKTYLGRIVIRTRSWAETSKIAGHDLPSFNHLDRQIHSGHSFGQTRNILMISGYKAERVLVESKKYSHRVMEMKVTTRDADTKNEYGNRKYIGEEIVTEEYDDKSLQKFIAFLGEQCEAERQGSFERVKHALSQPMGSDLTAIIDDIRLMMKKIEDVNLYGLISTRGEKTLVQH